VNSTVFKSLSQRCVYGSMLLEERHAVELLVDHEDVEMISGSCAINDVAFLGLRKGGLQKIS
jgi:hypothetical protein